ncbi:Uncharacterised protein [uncultured Ruminococcus sp.]|jgi:hypothetical protein|nr:Uncharacterised protein [uncultured Ruminococcus sp.]
MSILEKFFKNKKGPSEIPEPKNSVFPKIIQNEPIIAHAKAILCDEKMYDTSKATELIVINKYERSSFSESVYRAYFVTENGRFFSADKVIDRRKEYKMLENIEVHTQYIHYSDLRVEAENVVKAIIGQHDIALYKQLFGEVEEA